MNLAKFLIFSLVAMGGVASASTSELAYPPVALNPLPAAVPIPPEAPVFSSARVMSLSMAQALLRSTEGPAWHVLQVHGPVCEKKATKKQCKEISLDCKAAKNFGAIHKAPVACSNVYSQVMVEITTVKAPQKDAEPTKAEVKPKTKAKQALITDEELPPK